MSRKHVLFLAAFVAAGAALLSACGSQENAPTVPNAAADAAQNIVPARSAALTAKSATLFDDANFSDSGASQGLSGTGCETVARPRVTSSVITDGTLKLWTGANCTGKSVTITGNTANLGKLGFDNAVVSIRFADPVTTAPPTTAPGTELTATSAILDSGKNLSEPDGSQAVSGPGCANVIRPSLVSSIQSSGTYKIWTGANCTGTSKIVSGNVLDLGPLGFDKKVASIRFAG